MNFLHPENDTLPPLSYVAVRHVTTFLAWPRTERLESGEHRTGTIILEGGVYSRGERKKKKIKSILKEDLT